MECNETGIALDVERPRLALRGSVEAATARDETKREDA